MIRPIDLDLLGRERALPPAGLVLLAAALVAAALVGSRFAELRAESGALLERLEAAHTAGRARPAAGVIRISTGDAAADLKRVQGALRSLAAPWNDLFADVEAAIGADVGLLGLQPEPGAGRVAINGEARDLESALRFAERLNGG